MDIRIRYSYQSPNIMEVVMYNIEIFDGTWALLGLCSLAFAFTVKINTFLDLGSSWTITWIAS